MSEADGIETCPALLERVRDWEDGASWAEFHERYDPLLRDWCRRSGPDEESSKEVCQRIWVELAVRMPAFRYDPGRRFRGWLRNLWRFRTLDFIEERRREDGIFRLLGDWDEDEEGGSLVDRGSEAGEDREPGHRRLILLCEAEQAQAAVRARIDARTWQVYWHIAVDDWSLRETATALGMSYAAAFAAHQRVQRRLRIEGARRLAVLAISDR